MVARQEPGPGCEHLFLELPRASFESLAVTLTTLKKAEEAHEQYALALEACELLADVAAALAQHQQAGQQAEHLPGDDRFALVDKHLKRVHFAQDQLIETTPGRLRLGNLLPLNAKAPFELVNRLNKLADGGRLVAVNNALFVSGAEYLTLLESLCADGYMAIEELIPVAEDFTGYETTRAAAAVTDPAPFNHSTKIAVLRVRRKNG